MIKERPELDTYEEFPISREGYLAELLAETRQTQRNTRRTYELFRWFVGGALLIAVFWLVNEFDRTSHMKQFYKAGWSIEKVTESGDR